MLSYLLHHIIIVELHLFLLITLEHLTPATAPSLTSGIHVPTKQILKENTKG